MSESRLIAYGDKLSREQLALVPTPPGTATHRPVPHTEVVGALVETLGFRHIGVVLRHLTGWKDREHAAAGPLGGATFETAVLLEVVKIVREPG